MSTDSYMNFQLANTEEFIDGEHAGNLGEILVRCNNVLYVRGIDASSSSGAAAAAAASAMVA